MVHPDGVISNSSGPEILADFSSSTLPSDGSIQAAQFDLEEILDAVVELDEQLIDAGFHVENMETGL